MDFFFLRTEVQLLNRGLKIREPTGKLQGQINITIKAGMGKHMALGPISKLLILFKIFYFG